MQFFTFKFFKKLYFLISVFTLLFAIISLPQLAHGQSDEKVTHQQKSEILRLIKKAEQNQYRVNHIWFSGNMELRDRVLRDKTNEFLSAGNIFSQQDLFQSLKNLSKLKTIYEVRLKDVEVSLDEKEKNIELTITIREKRHSSFSRQKYEKDDIADVKEIPSSQQNLSIPIVDFNANESENILITPDHILSSLETNKRHRTNERFNNQNDVIEMADDLQIKSKSDHWIFNVPSLPVKQSDLIIIATILDGKAFLSADKSGVYSEFSIDCEKLLKTSVDLKDSKPVIVERAGGAVRYPSGKIQKILPFAGQEMPQKGHKYILFLKHSIERNLLLLTAYEIENNKVKALDQIDQFMKYNNQDSNIFLNKLKEIINN